MWLASDYSIGQLSCKASKFQALITHFHMPFVKVYGKKGFNCHTFILVYVENKVSAQVGEESLRKKS